MVFTIPWSPSKAHYINNALFYRSRIFFCLDAARSIIISRKEKKHKTNLNVYVFHQNCKKNENKSGKSEVAPTALLLLVNFGTCKHMHMHKRRNSAGSMSNLCSAQKIKSNINMGAACDSSLLGTGSAWGWCSFTFLTFTLGFTVLQR